MLIQITAYLLVRKNMLVNPLMTDTNVNTTGTIGAEQALPSQARVM